MPAFTPLSREHPGEEAISCYDELGVVCLRGAIPPEWVDIVSRGMDIAQRRDEPGHAFTIRHPGEPGYYCVCGCLWKRENSMKYAILRSGSRQLRAEEGEVLAVDRMQKETGEEVEFSAVLFADGEDIQVGRPVLDDVSVQGTVLEHVRGAKIRVFKYKRRKRYRRTQGHRQEYTRVRIDKINTG